MSMTMTLITVLIAYLFGAIPVGYLVAYMYGVDVTASGSGRTGGTNVLRAAGPTAAGLTVAGDVFKGLIPVYFIAILGDPLTTALSASATVLGHNYSVFLRFRGGVGAGTATGALGGLSIPIGVIIAALGIGALALTRYASMLSATIATSGFILLVIFAQLDYVPQAYMLTGVINMALMFFALRHNFVRIWEGTERKVGQSQ